MMFQDSWDRRSETDEDEDNVPVKKETLIRALFVGQSNCGKTYLTKTLVDKFCPPERPVVVVNDKTSNADFERLGWHQLDALRNTCLVVEDLIACKRDQFVSLQHMLNFSNHHYQVNPIFCITHAVPKNNIQGLLPFFQFVFVSADNTSVDSYRRLLAYYNFKEEEREKLLQDLEKCEEEYSYFMINVNRKTVRLTRADDSFILDEAKKNKDRQPAVPVLPNPFVTAKKFLSDIKNPNFNLRLFEIIFPFLSVKRYDPRNMTLTLRSGKSGEEEQISLLDYIATLTDEGIKPDRQTMKLHRYLKRKRIHLPRSYVLNKSMR
jgi:hypothetical protein